MDYCLAEPNVCLFLLDHYSKPLLAVCCVCYILFHIFRTDTDLRKSITVVPMVLYFFKKGKINKTSQSLCVQLKIVINRACLKKQLLPFFLYKREFIKQFSHEECDMCLYF